MTRARSAFVVLVMALGSLFAVCAPSSAGPWSSNGKAPSGTPTPPSPPPSAPTTISTQVHYQHSYHGPGPRMAPSDASWSPPACWYEPEFTPDQMKQYLATHYQAEHIAQEVLGQDSESGINYHTGEKGSWWKLTIPDISRADQCTATASWLWLPPAAPAPPGAPAIDPKTLAGLAYNATTLPAPALALHPPAASQLVNVDTQLTFAAPLDRVWVTAALDNPALGINVAATTVAVPAQLRVDAGTEYADPQTCTYDLTARDGTYGIDTSNAPCNITYRKASSPGAYTLHASLVWKVTWTPSADPDGAPSTTPTLPDGLSTTDIPVTVRENQAVVSGSNASR